MLDNKKDLRLTSDNDKDFDKEIEVVARQAPWLPKHDALPCPATQPREPKRTPLLKVADFKLQQAACKMGRAKCHVSIPAPPLTRARTKHAAAPTILTMSMRTP